MRALILALLLIAFAAHAERPKIGGSDCHHVKRSGIKGLECGRYFTQDAWGHQKPLTLQVDAVPLIVVNGEAGWLPYPKTTEAERKRMMSWYLPGVIDDREQAAITRLCGTAISDGATTIIGLTCAGAREVSPLLGSHPSAAAVIALSWATCRYAKWDAQRTHRYASSAGYINYLATLKAVATLKNLNLISRASGCL